MPSYAQCALAILNYLEILSVIVFGWSLGGHIAIELLPLLNPPSPGKDDARRCHGICLTGTPPVPLGRPDLGFKLARSVDEEGNEKPFHAESPQLSAEEVQNYAEAVAGTKFGGRLEHFIIDDVARTDRRARSEMWDVFRQGKEGVDQKKVVEGTDVSVAVINGAEEEAVDLDYLDGIDWGNLWREKCVRLDGLGHSCFWEDFGRFEEVFGEWVDSVQ
jgi:pimeloyl-ACP methyl ester carboxylesterase